MKLAEVIKQIEIYLLPPLYSRKFLKRSTIINFDISCMADIFNLAYHVLLLFFGELGNFLLLACLNQFVSAVICVLASVFIQDRDIRRNPILIRICVANCDAKTDDEYLRLILEPFEYFNLHDRFIFPVVRFKPVDEIINRQSISPFAIFIAIGSADFDLSRRVSSTRSQIPLAFNADGMNGCEPKNLSLEFFSFQKASII